MEDGELIYIIRKRYNAGETRNIAIARVTKTVVKTAGKTAIKEAGKKTIKELIPDAKTVKKWVKKELPTDKGWLKNVVTAGGDINALKKNHYQAIFPNDKKSAKDVLQKTTQNTAKETIEEFAKDKTLDLTKGRTNVGDTADVLANTGKNFTDDITKKFQSTNSAKKPFIETDDVLKKKPDKTPEQKPKETSEQNTKKTSKANETIKASDDGITVKRGDSSTNGSGVKISGEKPNHNIDNVKITEANGNELREDGIQTNNVTEQPKIQVTKQPQKPQIQNTNIHKHTMPSQPPNILATPNGTKTKVNYNDPELDNIRSLIRENEAAETLAQAGYKIEQNPKVPGTKNPDYLIENKIFDCYSPREGTSVRNIASSITRKIDSGQTNRIILNLDDWHGGGGDIDEIIKQLNEWSIPGLKEVKVINHYHEIIDIYP